MSKPQLYKISQSLGLKIATIAFLIMVLLIPMVSITSLIRDRSKLQESVVQEITGKWGGDQLVTGPILTIPFRTFHLEDRVIKEKGKPNRVEKRKQYGPRKVATFMPEKFECNGDVGTEVKSRGIYDAILYRSDLDISAQFKPDFSKLNHEHVEVDWEQAELILGVADMKGIAGNLAFTVNGTTYEPEAGSSSPAIPSGLTLKYPIKKKSGAISFSTKIQVNGSGSLAFVPVGKISQVNLKSPWKSPSFFGSKMSTSEITAEGFTASWTVMGYNRSFPQQWDNNRRFNVTPAESRHIMINEKGDDFGVRLIPAVDQYHSVERSAKYAVLFILLTFVTLFIVEVIMKKRVHPVQYLLIGFALVLFYTLLLSLSEQFGFSPAYVLAALASIALIGGYMQAIVRDKRITSLLSGLLFLLYSFLFITLNQEEYALLMGSVGLFVILGTIMFVTRNIDWYRLNGGGKEESQYDELE